MSTPVPPVVAPVIPSVLFVCVHNAGRSQMAAAGELLPGTTPVAQGQP